MHPCAGPKSGTAVPRFYYRDSVSKVLSDIDKYTGYGNLIDKELLRLIGPFTCNRDSLTVRELINELNKQGLLEFSISEAQKQILAEIKGVSGKVIDENKVPIADVSVLF